MLCKTGLVCSPLLFLSLYFSLYFKEHRSRYCNACNRIRPTGDQEERLVFFLKGVRHTVEGAVSTAQRLYGMFQADRNGIQNTSGRRAGSMLCLHDVLKERVLVSPTAASRETELPYRTASSAMEVLVTQGIAREVTGKSRNLRSVYSEYLSILNEVTDAPRFQA